MRVGALELTDKQRQKLRDLGRRYRIHLLFAFGSQVRRMSHGASDLDLAVLLDTPAAGNEDILRLSAELQRVLSGQEVDVVWLQRADPLLAWQACKNAHLVYGDPQEMVRYQTYAWRQFVEYGRFFALEADAVRRGIQQLLHAHR